MNEKCAVIDLGSNSIRMGIYSRENGRITTVEQLRYTVRLSEGLTDGNTLKAPATERTLEAFLSMRKKLDEYPGIPTRTVATEAMRRAENSKEFKQRVLKEAGFDIEILNGEQETRYGLFGARLSAKRDDFYMLDTGGGSFELALCKGGKLKAHTCLPYGAVVLTETFEPDKNGTEQLNAFIKNVFDGIEFVEKNNFPIVLLGGSNRLIGKLCQKDASDFAQEGLEIPVAKANEIINLVTSLPYEKRLELDGMEKKRADIITAGLSPLKELIFRSGANSLIISTMSVREGIANEMI